MLSVYLPDDGLRLLVEKLVQGGPGGDHGVLHGQGLEILYRLPGLLVLLRWQLKQAGEDEVHTHGWHSVFVSYIDGVGQPCLHQLHGCREEDVGKRMTLVNDHPRSQPVMECGWEL